MDKGLEFGQSLVSVGDFDADGMRDFLVGGSGFTTDWLATEGVWLYSGADLEPIFAAVQDVLHEVFGRVLADAGDVDGDGWPEWVAGLPEDDYGSVYLFGGASEIAWMTLHCDEQDGELGAEVLVAGDVDGDGTDDLLVGSPGSGESRGCAQIFSGRNGRRLRRLEGDPGNGRFGTTLARMDDLDGDGREDWLVGAPGATTQGYACAVSSATLETLYTLAGPGVGRLCLLRYQDLRSRQRRNRRRRRRRSASVSTPLLRSIGPAAPDRARHPVAGLKRSLRMATSTETASALGRRCREAGTEAGSPARCTCSRGGRPSHREHERTR
jgi:hypothetical protein